MKILKTIAFFLTLSLGLYACKVSYSFSGISTDAQSVSIQFFNAIAPLTPPTYTQVFTESLRDIFVQQTSLQLLSSNGELQFEGEVVDYRNTPVAISGTDVASLNRLTITVNVRFVNTLDETKNFEQRFTRFEDYPSSSQLADVEESLTRRINEQLTQDILIRAIGDW